VDLPVILPRSIGFLSPPRCPITPRTTRVRQHMSAYGSTKRTSTKFRRVGPRWLNDRGRHTIRPSAVFRGPRISIERSPTLRTKEKAGIDLADPPCVCRSTAAWWSNGRRGNSSIPIQSSPSALERRNRRDLPSAPGPIIWGSAQGNKFVNPDITQPGWPPGWEPRAGQLCLLVHRSLPQASGRTANENWCRASRRPDVTACSSALLRKSCYNITLQPVLVTPPARPYGFLPPNGEELG